MAKKQQKIQQKYAPPTQSSDQIDIEIQPAISKKGQPKSSQQAHQKAVNHSHAHSLQQHLAENKTASRSEYLVLTFSSLAACIFCCCPTGVFALYFAYNGRVYHDDGRYDLAYEHKKWANKCLVLTIVAGIVLWLSIIAVALP